MKKNVKTLALNKQTIAELESKKILGGMPPQTRTICSNCGTPPTDETCPSY